MRLWRRPAGIPLGGSPPWRHCSAGSLCVEARRLAAACRPSRGFPLFPSVGKGVPRGRDAAAGPNVLTETIPQDDSTYYGNRVFGLKQGFDGRLSARVHIDICTVFDALSDETIFKVSFFYCNTDLSLQSPPQWKVVLLLEKRTDIES